ncbi:MAG TPA: putative urea ABC transporter substrate-binding protein [Candidatus Sulfopaludibacter sp.]|jgi:NitT/TauT family transport system substrate-binding protein|nr:putative urea ABC transporter substrate-binding protein [Candidatus Sulfopaludibacter sp.]
MRTLSLLLLFAVSALAQKPTFTVGWSIYAGWTPYSYMNKAGILRKWADKYGINIKVQRFDYAPSLDAFVAKNIDACAMTNMEALDMPAASGVPTTVVLIGDYSNGNDALLVRNGLQLKDLAGKKLLLVQKTVSEYLYDRAMTLGGLRDQIKKVRLVNTSDSDIATAFIGDTSASAVVTWKPMVSQLVKQKGVTSLFNSSQIPGEIMDLTVIRTDVLNRADGAGQKFAKALAGAWFEMLSQMSSDKILAAIAEGSQDTLASYKEQLSTTKMFYTPQSAVDFGASPDLKQKMALVRQFCFEHGLLGASTKSVDDVAIRYPDSSVQGKADHVRLVFDLNYMKMAAQGKL